MGLLRNFGKSAKVLLDFEIFKNYNILFFYRCDSSIRDDLLICPIYAIFAHLHPKVDNGNGHQQFVCILIIFHYKCLQDRVEAIILFLSLG